MSYSNDTLRELRKLLARLYPRERDQERIAEEVGLDRGMLQWGSSAFNNWFEILHHANVNQRIPALLQLALEEFPGNEGLLALAQGRPIAGDADSDLDWKGQKSESRLLEKIMREQPSLVDISHLARGLECARSVCKITVAGGAGSGFLIAPDRLLTNNHVLPTASAASGAQALFNFQRNLDGSQTTPRAYTLEPDRYFKTSEADDWSVVAVSGEPGNEWGILPLEPVSVERGDFVNIIQHPGGGPKQISLSFEVVAFVGGGRVQYLTDTMPGSSGSPVFDRHWKVVSLHHSGGWLEEPGSTERRVYYRNQGIAIARIVEALRESG